MRLRLPISGSRCRTLLRILTRVTDNNELGKSAGLKRFFFIQPSQYSPGVKILSEQEKKDASWPGNQKAAEIFLSLRKSAEKLATEIPIYDLNTSAFAGETRDVFVDNCCHVNPLGNELMAKRIAEFVSRDWSRR